MKRVDFKNREEAHPCGCAIVNLSIRMMMMIVIGLIVVSCGGGKKTKDGKIDAEAVIEQQMKEDDMQIEVTTENWQNVVKSRFGIDLAVPKGWAINDVKSYFSGKTVIIIFNREGDGAANPREIATTIFYAVQAISSEGNFNVDVKMNEAGTSGTTLKGKVYDDFEQSQVVSGSFFGEDYINAFWYYIKDGVKIVNLDCDKGDKFIVKFEISNITI